MPDREPQPLPPGPKPTPPPPPPRPLPPGWQRADVNAPLLGQMREARAEGRREVFERLVQPDGSISLPRYRPRVIPRTELRFADGTHPASDVVIFEPEVADEDAPTETAT